MSAAPTAGPLAGLKVLDLSRLLPGGFCSLLLADLGAEVLKVEDTGMGDYVRWSPPYVEGAEDSARSALFLSLNRNKRSIRVDLKADAGKEVLLRLARDHDVLLESFRPGVLDRLGVGYERLKQENPGLVYCAITGYGQDGPKRDAAGHDMNYLALGGLLGLTGEPDGAPVQAAGQIADVGGGALMAAVGILAALRERERSGLGQVVDVSMFDGALSFLAMIAAQTLTDGVTPRRGLLPLSGQFACYRPYACSDGWVACGALEPKFWQAWCRGVGREDLIEQQFAAPGSDGVQAVEEVFRSPHARRVGGVRGRARLLPGAGARPAGGARLRAGQSARDGRRARAAGRERAGEAARPADQARPHARRPGARSRTGARRAHRRGPGSRRLRRRARSRSSRRPAPSPGRRGSRRGRSLAAEPSAPASSARADGLLKISELAERSGVSAGTIKHYLREGLLGGDDEIRRTSRNMAWYPPEFVERIRLIKRLQEERFMPLRVIGQLLREEPQRSRR